MNFSEFAYMIYSRSDEKVKKSEFVVKLIDRIMEKPVTEKDKQKKANVEYNPLDSLTPNALEKIFNGSRNISKEHARIILAHLNKENFDKYIIIKFNNDAIDYFSETLKEAGIPITDNQVSLACADTFEKILIDLAKATSKQSSNSSPRRFVKDGANKNGNFIPESTKRSNVKNHTPSENNTSPKDTIPFEELFKRSVFNFNIIGFLESDPTESLSPHFFDDMRQFIGITQQSYERKNTPHRDEKTSCKMIDFSKTLSEYVKYLEEQMVLVQTETIENISYMQERYEMPKAFRAIYEPPKDNKDFESRTLNYRNSLQALYNEIQSL